jgi:hypothetical protein
MIVPIEAKSAELLIGIGVLAGNRWRAGDRPSPGGLKEDKRGSLLLEVPHPA